MCHYMFSNWSINPQIVWYLQLIVIVIWYYDSNNICINLLISINQRLWEVAWKDPYFIYLFIYFFVCVCPPFTILGSIKKTLPTRIVNQEPNKPHTISHWIQRKWVRLWALFDCLLGSHRIESERRASSNEKRAVALVVGLRGTWGAKLGPSCLLFSSSLVMCLGSVFHWNQFVVPKVYMYINPNIP